MWYDVTHVICFDVTVCLFSTIATQIIIYKSNHKRQENNTESAKLGITCRTRDVSICLFGTIVTQNVHKKK